ncbi:kynureninase [Paenochrobactrum glaciei]|uniref:Kynureninase n=1 Tax=Paenochrobactrum glaciei TaxID=486407 RepID=A0ABP3RAP5_9HYPH
MSQDITLEVIRNRDAHDGLRQFRERFTIPENMIYLDGNSLGPAPKSALAALERAAHAEWGQDLIRSWNSAGWFDLPLKLGDQVGALTGAAKGQIAVCDSTSINIFKALSAAASLRPDRKVIVAEGASFPTDLYIAEGFVASQPQLSLKLQGVDGDTIEELLSPDVGVVLLNHVNYRSGYLHHMKAMTARIQAAGALVVWDLCHSAGALDVQLDDCNADFAVGCTYKYINGGPGAPAFIYVAKRHQAQARQPLSGWWGHARPFAFEQQYEAAPAIARFLCGTQPILSMQTLNGALEAWQGVSMADLRSKSLALTDLFINLVEERCKDFDLQLITPRKHEERGSQVGFTHPHAYEVMQALIADGVVGDFRAPDVLRFGFTPLYISFENVWNAVEVLRDVLSTERWKEPRFAAKNAVT